MAAKFGSASLSYYLGGRSLLAIQAKGLRYKTTAEHEDTTGIGDTVMKTQPTGVAASSIEHSGAFFDTTSLHAVLNDVADSVQETADVICAIFGGDTVGQPFIGYSGVYKGSYDVLSETEKLTKANTSFLFNGAYDDGLILHPLAARTTDTNGTAVDNAAGTSNGGAGYVQVSAFSGFSGVVVTIEHSTNNSVWATLLTFTTIAAAPTAERVAVSGTVNRYTRAVIDVTGSGSITAFVGFKRNA